MIDQTLNKDSFYGPPVKFAQCKNACEKHLEADKNLRCAEEDKNSSGYSQIVSSCKHLTIDDIIQPYVSEKNFTTNLVFAPDQDTDDMCYVFLREATRKFFFCLTNKTKFQF